MTKRLVVYVTFYRDVIGKTVEDRDGLSEEIPCE